MSGRRWRWMPMLAGLAVGIAVFAAPASAGGIWGGGKGPHSKGGIWNGGKGLVWQSGVIWQNGLVWQNGITWQHGVIWQGRVAQGASIIWGGGHHGR